MEKKLFAVILAILIFPCLSDAVGLSQNSGINPSDTYVIFDVTVQGQSNVTLSQPVYDSSTKTTTTNLTLSAVAIHFHVEAGYDSNGQLVVNLYSQDAASDPMTTSGNDFSLIRFAKNQVTVFDQDGNPIPIVLPNNAPLPQPLQFLGTSSSVLDGILVPNIYQYAQARGATVQIAPSSSAAAATPPPPTAQVYAAGHSSGGGSATWTYQQSGNVWILTQATSATSEADIQSSHVVQINNLSWYRNSGADSYRAANGSSRPALPSSSSWQPNYAALYSSTPPPSPLPPGCSASGSGQNVVFQHGLFSSCGTWSRMYGDWLSKKYQFGTVLIPSLSSTDHLSDQATSLLSLLNGSAKNNFVVIGHSQGGLIARDVAQRTNLPTPTGLTRGVITVDSPHVGAILALTGRMQAASGLAKLINKLAGHAGCTSPYDNPGCFIAYLAGAFSFPIINWAFDSAIPSSGDLIPGNPYLINLNSNTENFTRVGIESHSKKRWVLMRLGGDLFCGPDGFPCGGRAFVTYTQYAYIFWQVELIIALFDGDIEGAIFISHILRDMNNINSFWNDLTADGDSTDGIVQGSSQAYYGATARYVIGNADSHVGATRSDKVRTAIENSLDFQFQVPRIGCIFSVSPASYSVAANGGSGSLTVTSGAGCGWSAVSNDSWISVTAGATGTTSGTVSFSVAPNSSTKQRSGSITISGQTTFTITQAGATSCIYALSPTSFSAVSDGDAGTVSVTTQPGCIWTATSNRSWIQITMGSTGTGSGTFSFSVNANASRASRSGTITVADQVFALRQDGVPPPDPGCRPSPCPLVPTQQPPQ